MSAVVETKEIITMETIDSVNALQVFTGDGGVDPILQQVRDMVDAFEPDVSTSKGRKAIASFAYKISQFKTRADGAGKDLTAEKKKEIKQVDISRKVLRDGLDAERDRAREPLDTWEKAEQVRIAAEKLAADILSAWNEAEQLDALFDREREIAQREAKAAKEEAERQAKADQEQRIKEQAEHEERLKREAAAKAAKDAEEKAAREKAETERKAAEAIAAKEKAEREKIEAAQKAEQAKIDAAAKAESDRIAAAEKAKADKQAAIEEERRKAKAEADRVEAARLKKEADEKAAADMLAANKKHRTKIQSDFIASGLELGYPEDQVIELLKEIGEGKFAHTFIRY